MFVPNLPVGTFTVEVEAPGFRKAVLLGKEVPAASKVTVNAKLRVGAVESVTVTASGGADSVNTVNGELAFTVDSVAQAFWKNSLEHLQGSH